MRISRRRRKPKPLIPKYRINQKIEAPEVRVLDIEGNNLGVMKTADAIAKAKEEGLDLVEINPKADPPVAKTIDFTRFKYQKEKEVRKQKANSHVSELKGIRLSVRIGDHDMGVRQAQAEKFLNRGDKAKLEIILRGRERGKIPMAFDVIKKFIANIEENIPVRYEQEPAKQGNKVTAIIVKK
jgi:translation initiation factor IF-3